MNKELYNNIKNELDSLSEEVATPSYVGGNLLSQKLNGKTGKDKFTVIYAFYEYMIKRESFSFINTGDWATFFRDNLSNYLNSDNIKTDFDEIISDETLLNTILKVCNDEVKKNLYDCAIKENLIHTEAGSNKYVDAYKKIEESLIKEGLIENKDNDENVTLTSNATSKAIDDKIEDLKKRQKDLEQEKVQKRETMFQNASNSGEINTDKLIKTDEQSESLNIGAIEVEPQLASKLADNSTVAVTMLNDFFQNLKEEIKKSKMLKKVKLEVVEVDKKIKLVMNKKESIFDKIASSDNEIVRAIYNSAKEKLALFKSLVKPSKEVNATIKKSIINTNEKIKANVLKTSNEVKNEYTEFKEAMHEASKDTVTEASNQINDFANRVSDYGVSAREKATGKLYSIADKLTQMNNARVIMRSGTKSGEISNPSLLEEGKRLSA